MAHRFVSWLAILVVPDTGNILKSLGTHCDEGSLPRETFFARDPQGNRVAPYTEWDEAKAETYFNELLRVITSVNIYRWVA